MDALERLASDSTVYLVEGFTDTLTLAAHGFNAVGLVGAGGLKPEWLAPLGRFHVVAALDPDAAGRRAAARYEELFMRRGLRLATVNLSSDVNDFFRQHSAAALEFELMTETAVERMRDEGSRDERENVSASFLFSSFIPYPSSLCYNPRRMADEIAKTIAPAAGLSMTDKLRLLLEITKKSTAGSTSRRCWRW